MYKVEYLDKSYKCKEKNAVALGFFDGVHIGHREVISKTIINGYGSMVFTFDKKIGNNEILLPYEQKIELIKKMGIEQIMCPIFSEFKDISGEEFINFLYNKFNVRKISCGYDFKFGKDRKCGINELVSLCKGKKIDLDVVEEVKVGDITVSTTKIKSLLKSGDIELANKLLGYNYFIKSEVKSGLQLGRTINRPTINQHFANNQTILKYGAYATVTLVQGELKHSATNIGVKPTIKGSREPLCETYILDFSGDLYGQILEVYFFKFMRGEKVFSNLLELKKNILDIVNYSKNNEFSQKLFTI